MDTNQELFSLARLREALRENFTSLVIVLTTNDGLEVRDSATDYVISSIWTPYVNGGEYGIGCKGGTFRSETCSGEFIEHCYASV